VGAAPGKSGFIRRLWRDSLANCVLIAENAEVKENALRPLREARIDVADVPGKPGVHRAVGFLRPHFQIEELPVSLRTLQ